MSPPPKFRVFFAQIRWRAWKDGDITRLIYLPDGDELKLVQNMGDIYILRPALH